MTAIVSGSPDAARKLADFYGIETITGYDGYDGLLASGAVDAVYIALPNPMHANYAIRALDRGIHAMVEKPLALTVEECDAMIAASDRTGAHLMTAYRLHNEPGTVEVLEMIRRGEIGRPRLFSSVFSFQSDPGNHRLLAKNWGGPLQDIGVYCLNAARHVFGAEPVEAIAMRGHGDDPRFTEVEETLSATLRFPGDAIATFTVSFGAAPRDMYRVLGTKGEIVVDPGYRFETAVSVRLFRDGRMTEHRFDKTDNFGGQTEYFSDCILNGERPESDGGEGLADVRALRAIEAASLTGKAQTIATDPRPSHPTPGMVRTLPPNGRWLVL